MNNFFRYLAISLGLLIAIPAFSDENRMSSLSDHYLIEGMKKEGIWNIQAFDRKIEYHCYGCNPIIDAKVEAIEFASVEDFVQAKANFISKREVYCAQLASSLKGRCVDTVRVSQRAGCLSGFQSVQEIKNKTQAEVVYFFDGQESWGGVSTGPEILKATITLNEKSQISQGLINRFAWHLRRLTICW